MRMIKTIVCLTVIAAVFAIPISVGAQAQNAGFVPVGDNNLIKVPWLLGGDGPAGKLTFGDLVTSVLQILLLIVGSLAVLFLMYGGYRYITAGGNEESSEAAKKIITNSILGLVIVLLSFALITIIARLLITGRVGA